MADDEKRKRRAEEEVHEAAPTPFGADDEPRPAEREGGEKRGGGNGQRLRGGVCEKRLLCVRRICRVLYPIRRAARKWRNAVSAVM